MKHVGKFIIPIFFLILSFLQTPKGFAQTDKIDSLLNLLKTDKEDTNKVKRLNDISRGLRNIGEYEKAMQYANDVLQIFQRTQTLEKLFIKGKATAYNNIGATYYAQGTYHPALENYLASW